MNVQHSFKKLILLICFFISGCAALIYEMLWIRMMGLFLGNSQWAVAVVVAGFMAGLAVGSFFGGRAADRLEKNKLLVLYMIIELCIGISAYLSKPFLHIIQGIVLSVGIMHLPFWLQACIWFLLGFGILLIPTSLMGASLPVLARVFITSSSEAGTMIGRLYAVNIFGAVVGVLLSGFYLIRWWGISNTMLFAAGLNVFCGVILWGTRSLTCGCAELSVPSEELNSFRIEKIAASIFFIAGFCAMAAQIAWTRAMILIIGSSTYAFTIILLIYLLGISCGSALCSRVIKNRRSSWIGVSIVAGLAALIVIFSLSLFSRLPYFFVKIYPLVLNNVLALPVMHGILCGIVILLPTVLFGALYPLMMASAVGSLPRVGSRIGAYAMIGIAGNIVGSLAAGFLLIPLLSIEITLVAVALGFIFISAVSVMHSAYRHSMIVASAVIIFLTAVVILRSRWDIHAMTSGVFLYAPQYKHIDTFEDFKNLVQHNEILFHNDGTSSTVSVLQSPYGERFLRINGKSDASWGYDMRTQLLLAYLPRVFFQGQPQQVLIIGLGVGVTAGACSVDKHISSIDCIEIEPSVRDAAMLFTRVNKWVLNDPRLTLIYTDARHYLTGSEKQYDMIISEPSNPWMAGIATLYTQEAFMLMKEHLTINGIGCQWIHSYSMGEKDFKMVLATFASVFPHTMLFSPRENDFLMLGSMSPLVFDYAAVERMITDISLLREDLHSIEAGNAFSLIATTFVLDDADIRSYVRDSAIHRDDHLMLEFSAPRFLEKSEDLVIFKNIQQAKTMLLPKHIRSFNPSDAELAELFNSAGEAFMRLKNREEASAFFQKAFAITGATDARTLTNCARIENLLNKDFKAEELFKKAIQVKPTYALAYFHLGQLYAIKGKEDKGVEYLEKGLKLKPKDALATMALTSLYVKQGKLRDAELLLEDTLAASFHSPAVRFQLEQYYREIKSIAENKKN